MNKRRSSIQFRSALAPLIEAFIEEKQACGYKYVTATDSLWCLDRFLCEQGLTTPDLPKPLVERWTAKRPNESSGTHRERIGLTRRFGQFLIRQGHAAYLPDARLAAKVNSGFVPRIFSYEEIRKLFSAADATRPNPRSPLRHLIVPEIFRMLYSCGLRLGEATRLRVQDVNLHSGILTIFQTKFRKDRLVPMAPFLTERLRRYASLLGDRSSDAIFFPAPHSGSYHPQTIYYAFRQLLWKCRIAHGGRGQGPRLHDLRHSYAVHRLVRWYQEGANLNAKLLVLAKYMGHQSVAETQVYLQLTADLFPDVTSRTEAAFGDVIPRRAKR